MPSVGTVLSGGVTIGVLAGVFSGICYLLVLGLRWAGKLHATVQEQNEARQLNQNIKSCARCGRQLSLLALGRGRRIQCVQCKLIVCRYCCCRSNNSKWLCTTCKKHRDIELQSGEWFYQQVRQRFHSTVAAISSANSKDGEVRQFVEKLVEALLGGSLDQVPVGPLSSDPKYVKLFHCYHDYLSHLLVRLSFALQMAIADKFLPDGEVPSAIRTELKELIKQIVQKAKSLPPLQDDGCTSHIPSFNDKNDNLTSKSYEDILATAILNKVITKYQVKRRNANYKKDPFDEEKLIALNHSHKETESMDSERNDSETEDSDSFANSNHYYSWSECGHHDPLSVTIEECIEEVTTRYSSDEEEVPVSEKDNFFSKLKIMHRQRASFPELGKDIIDAGGTESSSEGNEDEESEIRISHGMELVNPIDSWEENWLFQRRKLKASGGTCQPVPVPMLVPLPSHDYKALIGDVDADETSDLSECSDSVLEDLIDGSCNQNRSYTTCAADFEDEIISEKHKDVLLNYIDTDLIDTSDNDMANETEEIFSSDTRQNEHNKSSSHLDTNMFITYEEVPTNHFNTAKTMSSDHKTVNKTVTTILEKRMIEATNEELIHSTSGEGSLEIQQDSEYTVAYAVPAQLEPEADETSVKPVPKPRNLLNDSEDISCNNTDKYIQEIEVSELATPPKPGTIAEREHLKWQQAPPLPNNPYSKENIEHRKNRNLELLNIRSSNEESVDFPELSGPKEPSLIEIDSKGYTKKSYKKYGRDYYINTDEENEAENEKDNNSSAKEKELKPQHPQQNIETKQQVSVRVEVEVARWPETSIEKLPKPSVQTQTEILISKPNILSMPRLADNITDDFYIALPSVKELAKHFQSPNETEKELKHLTNNVLMSKKDSQTTQKSPTRQVHSLTARSISREFREGLRGVNPVSNLENNELASELMVNSYENEVVLPSTANTPQQKKLKNNIEFWEKINYNR